MREKGDTSQNMVSHSKHAQPFTHRVVVVGSRLPAAVGAKQLATAIELATLPILSARRDG
jgi:hypothetical protein